MSMSKNEVETVCPANRQRWREWLEEHHAQKQSVWLIYRKKKSGSPTLAWSEAVNEALCFGWIDSQSKSIDKDTYMQFFSRRKPHSVWSKINKEKVQQLIDDGLMTKAGFKSIETARQNGSWTILDEVEALIIPMDLADAFQKRPTAQSYFQTLSRSDKRAILQWLALAKRAETRQNRIIDLVERAEQHLKPAAIQWQKNSLLSQKYS